MEESEKPLGIDGSAINKILENQAQELVLRSKELDLRAREIDHSHEFSQKSLDVQSGYYFGKSRGADGDESEYTTFEDVGTKK